MNASDDFVHVADILGIVADVEKTAVAGRVHVRNANLGLELEGLFGIETEASRTSKRPTHEVISQRTSSSDELTAS